MNKFSKKFINNAGLLFLAVIVTATLTSCANRGVENQQESIAMEKETKPFYSTGPASAEEMPSFLYLKKTLGINPGPEDEKKLLQYSRPIPGDANKFDPIANFANIQKYAGSDALLKSLSASYVRVDGTINFYGDPYAEAQYHFVQTVNAPLQKTSLMNTSATPNGKWFQEKTIELSEIGIGMNVMGASNYQFLNLGVQMNVSSEQYGNFPKTLSAPKCSFKQFWDVALTKGAPQDGIADIQYGSSGYSFAIPRAFIQLYFDEDCKLKK